MTDVTFSEKDLQTYDECIESLEHHGILGQKWGRKNGPPYPLDAEDHSASEKKAGWKKSLDSVVGKLAKKRSTAPEAEVKKTEPAPQKEETAEEKKAREAAEKKRIIDSGDANLVRANATSLSYQELNEAVNRVNLMQRLDQMTPKVETQNKIDRAIEVIDQNATRVQNGINTYNKVAKIYNAFMDPPIPVIDKAYADRKKEEEKKEQDKTFEILKRNPDKWKKNVNALTDEQLKALADRSSSMNRMKTQLDLFNGVTPAKTGKETDKKQQPDTNKQDKQEYKSPYDDQNKGGKKGNKDKQNKQNSQDNSNSNNNANGNNKQSFDININVNGLSTDSQQQGQGTGGKKGKKNKQNNQQNTQNIYNTTPLQNEVLNYATQKTLETELKKGMESYNKALYERILSAMAESSRFSVQKMDDVERYGFRHSDIFALGEEYVI